jgi:hypothetical protein
MNRQPTARAEVSALIGDLDFFTDDENARLLQGAIRLSAYILAQDSSQMLGQLLGRLLSFEAPDIQGLLKGAGHWQRKTWLRLVSPSLMPPGGPIVCTLQGHTDPVYADSQSVGFGDISTSGLLTGP